MKQEIKITGCYHSCPFFTVNGNTMECGHTSFDNLNPYDRLIITQDNSRDGNIPEKCPLRQGSLTIEYKLYTSKIEYYRFDLGVKKYGYDSEFRRAYESMTAQLRHHELNEFFDEWDIPKN